MNDRAPTGTPTMRWWRRPRWQIAGAAFLLGIGYSGLAAAVGAELRLGDRDLTLIGGAVVEASFALFGYLIGWMVEARRRERATASERQAHLEALARVQRRLAQAEKLASLGELAGAIAHEVRNPLAILRSMVQNLEEDLPAGAVAEPARATCSALLEEIDRLAHVTSSLVDFARPPALVRAPIPASELLDRVHQLGAQMLRSHAVRFETALLKGSPEPLLEVDADLICQVLLGLLENAAAAAPRGSAVSLGARAEVRGAVFEVADQGPGVPRDLRSRVFEPFFTTRSGGAGLGLAVARHVVEAHGGTIAVDDAPGGGARFSVRLPAASSPAETGGPASSAGAGTTTLEAGA